MVNFTRLMGAISATTQETEINCKKLAVFCTVPQRMTIQGLSQQNRGLIWKITKTKRAGGMTQVLA
jgi:hypothetical protein